MTIALDETKVISVGCVQAALCGGRKRHTGPQQSSDEDGVERRSRAFLHCEIVFTDQPAMD